MSASATRSTTCRKASIEINQNTSTVAASVTQQNSATGEISRNVASAAEGTGHVVAVLGNVANATTETRNSAQVVRDASETMEAASPTCGSRSRIFSPKWRCSRLH